MATNDGSAESQDDRGRLLERLLEDGKLIWEWSKGNVDLSESTLAEICKRELEYRALRVQDEDNKAFVELVKENLDTWRASLRIEDPRHVGKEYVKDLRGIFNLYRNSRDCYFENENQEVTWSLFITELQRTIRMIGQAYGIRGSELVNADTSIYRNAWEDLLAAVTVKDPLPQWSAYRTPAAWRGLLERAGKANSERKWSDLRKKNSDQMDGDTKSVRITRALAIQWGLNLPEFAERTSS